MWYDPLQAYIGDCVFGAALLALSDMGKLVYTFPVIQHITPTIETLTMTVSFSQLPQLIMMNNFQITGGVERVHWVGFDSVLGNF